MSTYESGSLLRPDQIVEAGLAASRTDGCVVVVSASSQANVRWANNTATTNGMAISLDFYVVAIAGQSAATASGSATAARYAADVAAVVSAAEAAVAGSAAGGASRDAMPLVDPDGYDDGLGESRDFAGQPATTSFEVFDTLLSGLARGFDEARSDERLLFGFARHEMTTTYLGTSTGVRRRWTQPTGTMELNAKSANLQRSAWDGLTTTDFSDVDVSAMAASLTERLGWAGRRVDLPPGRYDTVLPPTAVADFLIYLAWSSAARPAFEGRSAFAGTGGTRIGERLTDKPLTLYGDPTEAGLECAPFVATGQSSDEETVFDNGASTGRIELLRDGTISQLIQTRKSAHEYGTPFTPMVDNLVLAGGDHRCTTAEMVSGVDHGLLLTSQWYLREVDPMTLLLTGLTRDGVFLIEHGEVTAAVNNFRFNMSPLDVLRQAAVVGRTERCLSREWGDYFTRTAMPPVLVDGFHMSSVSKAE